MYHAVLYGQLKNMAQSKNVKGALTREFDIPTVLQFYTLRKRSPDGAIT